MKKCNCLMFVVGVILVLSACATTPIDYYQTYQGNDYVTIIPKVKETPEYKVKSFIINIDGKPVKDYYRGEKVHITPGHHSIETAFSCDIGTLQRAAVVPEDPIINMSFTGNKDYYLDYSVKVKERGAFS